MAPPGQEVIERYEKKLADRKDRKKKEKDGRGDSKRDDEDVEAGHADIEQGDDVPIR